jgi:hypothetical protein
LELNAGGSFAFYKGNTKCFSVNIFFGRELVPQSHIFISWPESVQSMSFYLHRLFILSPLGSSSVVVFCCTVMPHNFINEEYANMYFAMVAGMSIILTEVFHIFSQFL